MKTNIALIGFMGTGKTTVGKLLAEKTGKEFVETDAIIVEKAGRSIPEIFRQDGEIAFRELEITVIGEVAARKNAVIACGGGAVLNKINIDRLRKVSEIVCLTASPQVILKRTSADTDERPLLAVTDRTRQIEELMKFREPYYKRSADIIINTSRLNTVTVAERIIEKLKENESKH
ncbi:MAG: shikimate kinase [Dehalococcoidales bacterium]|nr:shikimate kinase [Dehalococcoidales bacterium]